jgi:chaperonin cofactor prefoldin
MIFWAGKTQKEEVKEEVSTLERLKLLETKISRLDLQVLDLNLSYDTLRDRISKKIKPRSDIEVSESKDLYSGMLLKE